MSRVSVLAAGRRAAEAGMVDTCTITRVTAISTDPVTGHTTPTVESIYSGACRFQEVMAFSRDTSPTPDDPQLMRYRVLQLPVDGTDGIQQGDLVVCNTSVNDPDLVGTHMVVRDESSKSEATSRRLGVEEAT